MLGLLIVSAFFLRLNNFNNSDMHAIDEFVYFRMALQVNNDISDYNSIPYGKVLTKSGRKLPAYFFDPLFKHPPLFTYLLAASMKSSNNKFQAAAYFPILFGAVIFIFINNLFDLNT